MSIEDAIGANLPGDFGEPTRPVAAVLEPDGSGRLVVGSGRLGPRGGRLYGVLYARTTDTNIEIARSSVLEG